MSRWPRRLLCAVVVTVLIGACSDGKESSAPSAQKRSSADSTTTTPPPSSVDPAEERAAPPTTTAAGAASAKSSATTNRQAAPGAAASGGASQTPTTAAPDTSLPVNVSVSPECAHRGKEIEVTIRSTPKAALSMVIGYADNQAHGAMQINDADEAGVYIWRLTVSPEAGPGKATVLVNASTPDGSRSGTGRATFKVAPTEGCK